MPKAVMVRRKPEQPKLMVRFFQTNAGGEPVREWLKGLGASDRKAIGDDIRTLQFGWPLGMPLVRKLEDDLWEVRSDLEDGIARVIFTIDAQEAILLHGFIKKGQKAPREDLGTARKRLKQLRGRS
jgi:phage-related protein